MVRGSNVALALGASLFLVGCATLGPEPKITLANAEVDATKGGVENVLIARPFGLADDKGEKTVNAAAIKVYGTKARPMAAIDAALSAAGGDGAADLLTLRYQLSFADAVEKFRKDGKKPDVIGKDESVDTSDAAGLKKAESALKSIPKAVAKLGGLLTALKAGDLKAVGKEARDNDKAMDAVNWGAAGLFDSLSCDYVLVMHVIGDAVAYDGGQKVQMYASLVNLHSGKVRFFGEVEATKGLVPVPYGIQIGMMANSLLTAANDKAPLADVKPETAKAEPSKKSKKKKS